MVSPPHQGSIANRDGRRTEQIAIPTLKPPLLDRQRYPFSSQRSSPLCLVKATSSSISKPSISRPTRTRSIFPLTSTLMKIPSTAFDILIYLRAPIPSASHSSPTHGQRTSLRPFPMFVLPLLFYLCSMPKFTQGLG